MTHCEVIRLPAVEPLELVGLQLHLLDAVKSAGAAPVVLLFQFPGQVLSLGRYHLYDGPASRGGVAAYRRLTGGRIINPGAGWIGCSLILPSRTAALGERDAKLRPEQVMNRYVRGAMTALRAIGADCFYPGRDALTCGGRELGMCAIEEDAGGALLVELFVAVTHGLDSLPMDMERFDPTGLLACRFYDAQSCTCLAREAGRTLSFEELADHLESGYRSMFGGAQRRDLTVAECAAAAAIAAKLGPRWLNGRAPDPSLSMVGRFSIQLGSMQAHLAAAQGRIERIEFYGDFIANSSGLLKFKQILEGRRLDLITLNAAVMEAYADGANFLLGCGDLSNVARLILKAS